MSTDDDALRWDGDEESAPAAPLPKGWRAVGRGSDAAPAASAGSTDPPAEDEDPDAAPAGLGNAGLVAVGLLAGVYLLYTVGWVIGGSRLRGAAAFFVSDAAFVPMWAVAIAAPALWYAITLVLTRHSAAWVRFAWLVAGALLLLPWPFLMSGAVAA